MDKFKCNECGSVSDFQPDMTACPICQAALSDPQLLTMIEPEDIAASIDTARNAATLAADYGNPPEEQDDDLLNGSSKTAIAADLGYADIPEHLETLDRSADAYETAGKSSTIPPRSFAEDDASAEFHDYKIESEIGQGAFGFVYRAVQVPLERHVAIKLLKPLPLPRSTESDQSKDIRQQEELKVREEFLREAQFTGRLEHPNIVPIHDVGIVSGGKRSDRPFYVMKEIQGSKWQDVLADKSREENIEIFNRVVDAMGFSHSRNILHCDLKPENIMLGGFGEVLVVDWGQAIDTTRIETFRPGGTPAYCSPEMAQYWCDFAANSSETSNSKRQIGPRSDVYLLGAMLFQIVTGRPPHFGLKGETPVDVMKRASRNEIRSYDEFAKDELMQIALRALRKSKNEINTVAQLQAAMKSYEERKQSIDIRDRAFELLENAKVTSNYDAYQKAKFGFEESLELWKENLMAREGLQQTRLSCAELALQDQNFDLGLGMLAETETDDEVRVKEKLRVGKKRRDRRKRMVGILSLAFAAAVVIGLAVTLYLGNQVRLAIAVAAVQIEKAKIAKTEAATAAEAKTKAEQDAAKAVNERTIAEQDATKAKQAAESAVADKTKAELDAAKAKQAAESAVADKTKAQQDAAKAKQEEIVARADAEIAKKQAAEAEESAKLLRYKTDVTAIEQKVASGDFRAAQTLLDLVPNKSTFEWRRLDLLSHPEIIKSSLFPMANLNGAKLSGDRKIMALCFDDRIEIRDASDLKKPILSQIKQTDVRTMALSYDGKTLAIGKIQRDANDRQVGVVQVIDASTGVANSSPLTAQSTSLTGLEFNRDGTMLMSIGQPDKIQKTAKLQHELMIWKSQGNQWSKVPDPDLHGILFRPTRAVFSEDGRRIVTSSSIDQLAFVLEMKKNNDGDQYFDWLEQVEKNSPRRKLRPGFVTSVFDDEAGKTVISIFSDTRSDTSNQIVVWDVDQSDVIVPVSTQNNQTQDRSDSEVAYPTFNPGQTVSVDMRINDLDFNGQVLLAAAGNDKKLIYWDLANGGIAELQNVTPKIFSGHGKTISSAVVLNSGSQFVSIATGPEPEVLLTDLATYRKEWDSLEMNDTRLTDESSPFSLFESSDSGRVIVGNDHGLVSINDVDGTSGKPELKWQVSAWNKHLVTREYLFALSTRDDLYRYNLDSGELESILTKLSQIAPDQKQDSDDSKKISSIEISDDARFAVVQRKNRKPEFEIWNLQDQSHIVVSYGDKDGLRDINEIPFLTISADGQWIAGGRIRFYVWRNDGTVVGFAGVEGGSKERLSSLRFFAGSSRLGVGTENLLRVYDVAKGLDDVETYPIAGFPASFGQPNIVDARKIDDQYYAVIRQTYAKEGDDRSTDPGLGLIRLPDVNEPLVRLIGAQQATITEDGQLLAVSRDEERPIIRFDLKSNSTKDEVISVPPCDVAGRTTDPRKIFRNVYKTPSGDLVVNWLIRNEENTVSISNDGKLSNLSVIASPSVKAVGLSGNRAVTLDNEKVRFWDLSLNGDAKVSPAGSLSGSYRVLQLSSDGTKAFAASSDQSESGILDMTTGAFTQKMDPSLTDTVTAAAWSPDGRLALGHSDGKIEIWRDNVNQDVDAALSSGPIDQLQFSADGYSMVAVQQLDSANSGVAYVLRENNRPQEPLAPQNAQLAQRWISVRLAHADLDPIIAAAISTDGKRVVTGSNRGRVTLWNSDSDVGTSGENNSSERELLTLHEFLSSVRFVGFGKNESSVETFETVSPPSSSNNALIIPSH